MSTHPEKFWTGLVDGHYDYSISSGQFSQQHHGLISRHAVQSCGRLIQENHLCHDITENGKTGEEIKQMSNFLQSPLSALWETTLSVFLIQVIKAINRFPFV